MHCPLLTRAHHRATRAGRSERVLELVGVELLYARRNSRLVFVGAAPDDVACELGKLRERSVEVHPAPVATLVEIDKRKPFSGTGSDPAVEALHQRS